MQRVLSCRTSTQVKEQTVRMGRGPAYRPAQAVRGMGYEIGVGIVIARDPLLGPGRALFSASGSYRG
jgi:hypothetical protein